MLSKYKPLVKEGISTISAVTIATDDFNKLEAPAKKLLLAACEDNISFLQSSFGRGEIKAGKLCVDNIELLPIYKKAITHLVNKGLIEELTNKNHKTYNITEKGISYVNTKKERPVNDNQQDTTPIEKASVFISYSHVDENLKDRLIVFLTQLKRDNIIEVWTDRDILAGDRWDELTNS
jgi:hypothetical protein